jgi:hypothetical protein
MENRFIPIQKVGSKLDLHSTVACDTLEAAERFFELVKNRLLNVNQWDEICSLPSSTFRLINSQNQEIAGFVKEDDYIRINIPGPGTSIGEGYDWVKVETIIDQELDDGNILSITVRPTHHPLRAFSETAHFFSSEATSTFVVKRVGKNISAEVHGRNEIPNNDTTVFIDNLRNTFVGWGAKIGFSYPQWSALTNGLIKN